MDKLQIWFTQKDDFGSSTMKSLSEYKGIRRTDNIENGYLLGKYGATPDIRNFSAINKDND